MNIYISSHHHYWLMFCIFNINIFWCINGNETHIEYVDNDDGVAESQHIRFSSLPLDSGSRSKDEPLIDLRRKYKLKDFLWTGSGDGPMTSDKDGGLAWEDNGGPRAEGSEPDVILVTKTMVLFKTVMTTIYSVEFTPTLVISTPEMTLSTRLLPEASPSLPLLSSSSSQSQVIEPSPTFSVPIEPTATPTPPIDEEIPTPSPDTSISTNPLYWVNTIIKANASEVTPLTYQFQNSMQQNLARVYASAFKRHLLNSLGVLKSNSTKRKRRHTSENVEWILMMENRDSSHKRIISPAMAATNVSVSIINVTTNEVIPSVSMEYFVCAEGKPVPAISAVQDMSLVTKTEMEDEIGYEVIKKAEALLSPEPGPEKGEIRKASTSTWFVVALVSIGSLIILMIILILVIVYICKGKRENVQRLESSARPRMALEGGVINPAFIGSQRPTSPRPAIFHEREKKRRETSRMREGKEATQKAASSTARGGEAQESLAKDLDVFLSPDDGDGEVEDIESFSGGSSSEDKSPVSGTVLVQPSTTQDSKKVRAKTSKYPRRQRSPQKRRSPKKDTQKSKENEEQRPLSASSREKVMFGHLDICEDPNQLSHKPISETAKKLMPPRGTTARRRETKISSSSVTTKTEKVKRISEFEEEPQSEERDREIGESVDTTHIKKVEFPSTSSPKKDAQVQTPTRMRGLLKTKPRAKPRKFPSRNKMSAESLISTESEEIIEVHHIEDSSSTENNPLGKMRKRFHQFLDDAFNVIGKKEGDDDASRSKSAKVQLTHHIETKEQSRPWTTSHVIHEESIESPRPKSATLGPPKRAWTASTERRCHSATSSTSGGQRDVGSVRRGGSGTVVEEGTLSDEEPDQNSSPLSNLDTSNSDGHRSIGFPRYPIYPDIPFPSSANIPGTNSDTPDPAVPLIAAIKEEIKRFERVKVTESEQTQFHSRWST